MFGPIYRACAELYGWTMREVDDMELWEIAVAIRDDKPAPGINDPDLIVKGA